MNHQIPKRNYDEFYDLQSLSKKEITEKQLIEILMQTTSYQEAMNIVRKVAQKMEDPEYIIEKRSID
jgi:hypothetical protein